jgi:uncharacterized protein YabE (DUF348 family)
VRRSPIALVLQAAVVLAVVAGTTAFVTFDKTVQLSVDGRQTTVRSFARTVGDVLASRGIAVGPHDLVVPSAGTALSDHARIVVRFGRPLDLTVDGRPSRVWTTAQSVDEAMALMGLRTDRAFVSASRYEPIGRQGLALSVRLPHQVTFLADGRRVAVTTTAPTVGAALAEAHLKLRKQDRVDVDLASYPQEGEVVSLTRIDGRRVTQQVPIAFSIIRQSTSALFKGDTQVQKAGSVGVRVRTWTYNYVNGKLAGKTLVSDTVAAKPVTQVLLVGTKPRPSHSPTADGLNWAALAQCESGGNPQAYNPAGPYYGLYQFSASTWHSVGGAGLPTDASSSEQTYRAQILYNRSGAGQWPVCGKFLFT